MMLIVGTSSNLQVDITEGISKQVVILYCKVTNRYHIPPTAWIHAELESKELLTFCIKRVSAAQRRATATSRTFGFVDNGHPYWFNSCEDIASTSVTIIG